VRFFIGRNLKGETNMLGFGPVANKRRGKRSKKHSSKK
jgi:hypothetical protein